jgi:hypothetical protein
VLSSDRLAIGHTPMCRRPALSDRTEHARRHDGDDDPPLHYMYALKIPSSPAPKKMFPAHARDTLLFLE